jgi:histidinol dehydrogenase
LIKSIIIKDAKLDAAKMRNRTTNTLCAIQVFERVQRIINDVAKRGDYAIVHHTKN